ncbi:biotin-dependent carboxyltransferase family protein [Gracilibacillus oryzae]|uniref:Biotin-dependent carboxyltransferase family protein n=1 Tax=Gracilibacillus oryzae TaxID=1672701 RepID=A0A7C8GQ32_9BACI|nr:biotin-dependent carboxyltransferase family protein [Gracilibacillus oryzae]KAB8125856.1 biotin-dependent carboxyltransferase family protein [Gracilibacillus oryzae]
MIIIEEGLHTTIQDLGRNNYRSLGFSLSGPMDKTAMRIANFLVGNDDNDAVLEISFLGPTIEFTCDTIIAITGAKMTAFLNGYEAPLYRPIPINKGDTLQCRAAKKGIYSYLSVKGGIQIEEKLSSRSMIARYNSEEFLSRKLNNDDYLPVQPYSFTGKIHWKLDHQIFDYIQKDNATIHFIEGPQISWFNADSVSEKRWKVSSKSNRMGYRLIGQKIETIKEQQLLTEPVQFGAIQIPPSGEPIILMADGQPTGGYPKLGQVIQADLATLSQITPAKEFTLEKCSIESAMKQLHSQEKFLAQLKLILSYKWREMLHGTKL